MVAYHLRPTLSDISEELRNVGAHSKKPPFGSRTTSLCSVTYKV
jgi:hypothetical protein